MFFMDEFKSEYTWVEYGPVLFLRGLCTEIYICIVHMDTNLQCFQIGVK